VVAVVQTDAQDLVRAGDGGRDALVTDRSHVPRGYSLGHDGLEQRGSAGGEERFVKVTHDIGNINVGLVGDEDHGTLSARAANACQPHR
jgi:hypothetical protein